MQNDGPGATGTGMPRLHGCRKALACALITLALVAVWWGIGGWKEGFFIDEVWTFLLSNHQYSKIENICPTFVDGEVRSGEDVWQDYLTVNGNKRFDYANVVTNQSHDVHPPLYYILVHTAASIFPEMDEVGVGLLVNIPLACVVFWQMAWIFRQLGVKGWSAVGLSAAYVLGVGFLSYEVLFFRMYCLLTVWCSLLLMVLLKFPPEERASWRYCAALGLALFGGAMTQYYFLIYAFLLCALYALFVVWKGNWQKLFLSIATAALVGGTSILLYPAMLNHIFKGYRGQEAFSNVQRVGHLWERLWSYLQITDRYAFGQLLLLALLLLLGLLIVSLVRKKSRIEAKATRQYALLVLPACVYILLVSQISPFIRFRYTIVVTGFLYIALFAAMANVAGKFSPRAGTLVLALAGLMLLSGYRGGLDAQMFAEPEGVAKIAPYKDSLNVYIYAYDWRGRAISYFQVFRGVGKILFVDERSWEKYADTNYGEDSIVVWLADHLALDRDEVISTIQRANGFGTHELILKDEYVNVYFLK